jgi:hypothetical protein
MFLNNSSAILSPRTSCGCVAAILVQCSVYCPVKTSATSLGLTCHLSKSYFCEFIDTDEEASSRPDLPDVIPCSISTLFPKRLVVIIAYTGSHRTSPLSSI